MPPNEGGPILRLLPETFLRRQVPSWGLPLIHFGPEVVEKALKPAALLDPPPNGNALLDTNLERIRMAAGEILWPGKGIGVSMAIARAVCLAAQQITPR